MGRYSEYIYRDQPGLLDVIFGLGWLLSLYISVAGPAQLGKRLAGTPGALLGGAGGVWVWYQIFRNAPEEVGPWGMAGLMVVWCVVASKMGGEAHDDEKSVTT